MNWILSTEGVTFSFIWKCLKGISFCKDDNTKVCIMKVILFWKAFKYVTSCLLPIVFFCNNFYVRRRNWLRAPRIGVLCCVFIALGRWKCCLWWHFSVVVGEALAWAKEEQLKLVDRRKWQILRATRRQ